MCINHTQSRESLCPSRLSYNEYGQYEKAIRSRRKRMIDDCLSTSSEDEEHHISKKYRRDGYSGNRSFEVTFDKKGIYVVHVEITKGEPLNAGKEQENKLTKKKNIVQSTFKVIHVEDPDSLKEDEDDCSWDAVAVNGKALSPFVNMTRSLQPGISAKVNLGAYLSHFIHIPLKFDLTVSSVLIQPWLLPPGNYRVSVNVTTPSHHKRFSGLFEVLENNAQSPLLPPIRIITTPEEEIFTSSIERLTINATRSYNVYALPQAGFVKEHHLRFQWSCKGDRICYSIRGGTKAGKDDMKLNNYINLNVKDPVLDIKEGYITTGSSITILLTVISEDLKLGWHFKTETVKSIHFLNSPVERLGIRCVMNCWSLVDRSTPLVLKLGCNMCSRFAYSDLQIRWQLLYLNRAVAQKEISHVKLRNSTYFIIHDLDDLDVEAFFVEVKGEFLPTASLVHLIRRHTHPFGCFEINISENKRWTGKARFSYTQICGSKNISQTPADKFKFKSCQEDGRYIDLAPGSSPQGYLADKLAHWDIDVVGLMRSIYQSQSIITPIIFTIRQPDYVVYRTIGEITDLIIEEFKNSRLTRSVKKRIVMWLMLSTAVGSRRSFPVSYAFKKGETFTTLTHKDLADMYKFFYKWFVRGETVLGPLSKAIEDARGNKAHLKLILKILDLFSSGKQEITYNNINLVLMSALRFSTVTYYDFRIADKLVIIVEKAFSLHKIVYANEHQNTNLEIERLLFGITNGVFRYLRYVGGVLEEPDTLETISLKNRTISLLLDMMKFIPDTLIWEGKGSRNTVLKVYPNQRPLPMMKTMEGKGFTLQCLWLEPWHFWGNISLDLNHSFFFMTVDALQSEVPENSVFQHITLVAFSSDTSLLPLTFEGLGVLSSLLIIRIENSDSNTAVRPTSNSSFYFGIKININDVMPSKDLTPANEAVGSTKNPQHLKAVELTIMPNKFDGTIKDSACLILKIDSSKDYASLIEFVSKSDYKLAVVLQLTNTLKEVISLAHMKPIILPRDRPLKYLNITQGSNGIFLPAMTLRQYVNEKEASYYIMIRWMKGQKLKKNGKGKTNRMGTAMRETVSINCHLMVCLEWLSTRQQLQSKDCQVTSFTGGEPPYLTCICNKGNVFTGAMAACPFSNIEKVPESKFHLVRLQVDTFPKMNLHILTLIIAMWMIFIAILLVVRKSYKHDEYMGMTYALPGAFCPLAEEQYLVCIVTGSGFDSGTDCTPHLVLLGEKNESGVLILDLESHPFQPSTEIWIAVSCAYPLGKLQGVILSLDNDGYDETWYVSEVYARNLETNEEAFFIFDQWLPNTIEPNKQFLIESASVTGSEGTNIRRMFRYYRRMLMSLHMLGGIYHNIPGSKFTKAQHALYTFSSLMILMSILIPVVAKPHRRLRGDLGVKSEFESSTKHYAIAFISATVTAVLALPIGILLDSMWTTQSGINVFWPQNLKMTSVTVSGRKSRRPLLADSNYNATEDILFRSPSENKVTFLEGSGSYTQMRQSAYFMGSDVFSYMRRKVKSNVSDVKHRMSVMRSKATAAIKRKHKFEILPYIVTSSLLLLVLCLSYYLGVVSLYVDEAESDAVIFIFFTASFIMCFIALPTLLFFFTLFLVFKPNAMRIFDMSLDAEFRAVGLQEHLPTMSGLAITIESENPIRVDRIEGESEHELTSSLRKWHRQFCKKLLSIEEEEKVMKRMKVPEKNVKLQTVFYIVIVLVIINIQSGGVYWRYLQTQYITDRLELDQTYTSVDEALKDTDIWDYLTNVIHNRTNQWFSEKDTSDLSVLTAVQLQQVRVTDYAGDCKTKRDYPQLIDLHCHWDIEDLTVDTKNFTTKWHAATDVEVHNAFTYTPGEAEEEIKTEKHTYPHGGYTVFFSTTDAKFEKVDYLKSNSWLDNRTRAVILRMDFLNSALDFVTEVELVYEFTSIGISKSSSVYTFPLDYGVRETLILFVFASLFALMTLYSMFNQGNKLYAEGASKFWFAYEHWIILFRDIGGIVCISMSVVLIYIRQDKVKEIREIYVSHREGDSHVRLDSLGKLTSKIIMLVSLLGGSCLLQVVLRLRQYQDTKIFVNMVPQSTRAFVTPLMFSTVLAMLASLWFFTTIKDFATYYESVSWLLRLLLKPNDLAMIDSHSVSGGIFIIFGPGVMFFVCLNCVLAVINDVFSELKWKVKQKLR